VSAPTLIQHAKAAFATAATFSKAFASPNTAGSTLLAFSYNNGGGATPTVSDTAGNVWTLLDKKASFNGPNTLACFICASCVGGSNTVTYDTHATAGSGDLVIVEYSAATVDKHAINNGTSSTQTSGNVTTTVTGEVLVGYVASSVGSLSPGTFFTSQESDAGFFMFEDRTVSTATLYDASASSSFGAWAMGIVTLAAVVAGAQKPVVCIMQ
jgi:hypothetical protein